MSEASANQVLLRGVVVGDPDLCTTQTFGPVCCLRIRCPGAHPLLDDAEHAGNFAVLAIGTLASQIAPRVHARSRVTVKGWLASTHWELPDGREQEAVSVIAEQIELLANASRGRGDDGENQRACVEGADGCEGCRERRLAIRHAHTQGQVARTLTGGGD